MTSEGIVIRTKVPTSTATEAATAKSVQTAGDLTLEARAAKAEKRLLTFLSSTNAPDETQNSSILEKVSLPHVREIILENAKQTSLD